MKKIKIFALSFLLLSILSCNKDDGPSGNNNLDPNPTTFAENFGNEISRNFLGTIIDNNSNPIENVMISIGNSSALTDSNGVFIINSAAVHERFAYVKAEKAGYIHGSRAVIPSTGTNKVTIMLLEETVTGTTNSGTAETIALPNGASVALEGNYIKEDGSEYLGSVNVIIHHLDPSDENMQNQMPGMLYAANAQNEERLLQTFGMLAVKLRGSGGEDLNLAEGSTAEIKMPLDASLLANAPSTIPLWYFDEANGYWIEDGEATLVGDAYVGIVSHFSFWNCDIPAEAVNLCITITDEDDHLLNNLYVTITSTTYGTRGGYTNENGEVCGLVPSNEALEINASNYGVCGNATLYTGSVDPFNVDSSISIVVAANPDIISETIIGIINNCDGNTSTNGYVVLTYGNQQFSEYIENGDFEISSIRCSDDTTFSIEAYDYDNAQTTGIINYIFTSPLTDLGAIQSCNTIEEFITYQVEDHPEITYNFNIQSGLDGDFLYISYYSDNQENFFEFYISGFNGSNTYTNGYLNFVDENFDGTTLENSFQGITNVTTFGNIGDYIDINFTGVIDDLNSSDEIPISGTIHVLRDF